jgi:hypothetical protein
MRQVASALAALVVLSQAAASASARGGANVSDDVEPCGPPPTIVVKINGLDGKNAHLDPSLVRRVVRANRGKLQHCFEAQLRADPALRGTMRVSFVVGADGGGSDVAATGVHAEVDACFVKMLSGLRYPRPADGATVKVSFTVDLAVDDGMRVFDTDTTACKALPAALIKAASAWVRAYEAGDAKALVELLPASVRVRGKKVTRARIAKAIAAAGSVADWMPTSSREWLVARVGKRYVLRRGYSAAWSEGNLGTGGELAPAVDEPEPELILRKVSGRWRVVEIVDGS